MRASEKLLRAGLLLACVVVGDAWAALSARLDRERIAEGETVRLIVETDGQASGSPDTSPLEEDFDILSVASGSQVNIVNGRMNARTTWTITLAPKRSGQLIVPPLELKGEQSPRLSLQVSEAPVAAEPVAGHPIFIETEVDRANPYVQGMVRYTVRLIHRVKLAEGSLTEPRLDNALIRRLGEDREYTVDRDGYRFRVIEREYAVFPQSSGDLVIPGPVLDARVPDKSSPRRSPFRGFLGRDPFDDPFFSGSPLGDVLTATRPVRIRGEKQVLNVRPRPIQADGSHWLPAQQVELSESWQPEGGSVRVGDPLTRTISIRALGLTGEQLPDLDTPGTTGFKVYPDRAKVENRDLNRTIEGKKIRSIAYVAVRAGRFTLPGIRLRWWDTLADREQVIELPERTIAVLPGVSDQDPSLRSPAVTEPDARAQGLAPAPAVKSLAEKPGDAPSSPTEQPMQVQSEGQGMWLWASVIFAVLWLMTLSAWWRARRYVGGLNERSRDENSAKEGIRRAEKRLLSACRANDPRRARRSLLEWANANWPDDPVRGLDELASRLDDKKAARALADLDRLLYRGDGSVWNGNTLEDAVKRISLRAEKQKEGSGLPELYA